MPSLDDEKLEKIAELFLERIAIDTQGSALVPNTDQEKENILSMMVNVLKETPNLTEDSLRDPGFIKQMSLKFVTLLSLNKIIDANNSKSLDELKKVFKDIGLLDDKEQLDLTKVKDLKPEQLTKLRDALENVCQILVEDLQEVGFNPQLKPGQKKPEEEEEAVKKEEYKYTALTGLISGIPGTYQAVIFYNAGNGNGFADLSPNYGSEETSFLSRQNNPFDFYADSPDSNANTMSNYLEFAGDAFVSTFINDLSQKGMFYTTPSPLNTKPSPYNT